jgi:hypothetical protein
MMRIRAAWICLLVGSIDQTRGGNEWRKQYMIDSLASFIGREQDGWVGFVFL